MYGVCMGCVVVPVALAKLSAPTLNASVLGVMSGGGQLSGVSVLSVMTHCGCVC